MWKTDFLKSSTTRPFGISSSFGEYLSNSLNDDFKSNDLINLPKPVFTVTELMFFSYWSRKKSGSFYLFHVCKVNSIISTIITVPGNYLHFFELGQLLAVDTNAEFSLTMLFFLNRKEDN